MVDVKISGRKISVSDSLRDRVNDKLEDAFKVFDISPMTCDVVLRVDTNPSKLDRKTCEVTVRVRNATVRVSASADDMNTAIDDAADKITRQLRKYKTKVIDKRQRTSGTTKAQAHTQEDLSALIAPAEDSEDDALVREKFVDLLTLTEEEALVQTDLLGHDFYLFTNAKTGLTNVIYRRKNGGYGILKPRLEEIDG